MFVFVCCYLRHDFETTYLVFPHKIVPFIIVEIIVLFDIITTAMSLLMTTDSDSTHYVFWQHFKNTAKCKKYLNTRVTILVEILKT